MKKIPTLFKRVFENHKIVDITDEITPGCEEAFLNGIATVKWDGACCAVIDGEFYKRYDTKKGKKAPEGAIPCCDPDPVTGHWPHWVKVNPDDPADKWFVEAYNTYVRRITALTKAMGVPMEEGSDFDGTYEAVGPHFNGNPEGFDKDVLFCHGLMDLDVERTFDGVKEVLKNNKIEGIVFWLDDEPVCKIKRTDFGFEWPVKEEE